MIMANEAKKLEQEKEFKRNCIKEFLAFMYMTACRRLERNETAKDLYTEVYQTFIQCAVDIETGIAKEDEKPN